MTMEPTHNSNNTPSNELPEIDGASGQAAGDRQPAPLPEVRQNPAPGIATSSSSAQPAYASPPPVAAATPQQAQPDPAVLMATLVADDADLIEKEWIIKAKSIVEQTKNDPRQQNIKMNTVKADYLKKRYNKDVKVSES